MTGKKFLAGVFAVLVLVKLTALLIDPGKWLYLGELLLSNRQIITGVYLVLLAITGFYIFSRLNLIDVALVMFFTSLLTGLTLLPYSTSVLKLGEEMIAIGFGKAWLAIVIWGAVALAVLYRVFSSRRS
jgi:4-amino-4-deoxy-L-arabinose transferase-like glycosyltransferase